MCHSLGRERLKKLYINGTSSSGNYSTLGFLCKSGGEGTVFLSPGPFLTLTKEEFESCLRRRLFK